MNDIVVRVENLSKSYDIAKAKNRNDTLKDQLGESLKSIFRHNGRAELCERTFWALKDIFFDVKQGEIVGIIGHNGAGKSTLLKIISQITVPTNGRAEIYGRVGSLLEVGTGFHPELTGRENIYLNGAIIGMKKEEIRRRFDEIVEFAEIGKFLDTPVKRYSSGMYVRLGFAVAAHLEPEVLLVDEVLAVGDSAFQKKCLDKIGDIAKSGRTVLFISHNMVAVNTLCKRVIWIKEGKIVEDGPTAGIVTTYLGKSLEGIDSSEEVWDDIADAPGEDIVRLHRVRVRRQDGRHSDPLTMQTSFQVEIEFWNLEADANLHITLHIYTAEHIIAFTTGSLNSRPMPAGLFRSVCHVPGDLLNTGLHRFVVLVVKDKSNVIYNYASRVPINIIDVNEREGNWFGREPGVVQPKLEWTTEYLSEGPEVNSVLPEVQQAYS
jgi:lipopolysaccharide transport system ATP-binding protein